MGAIEAPAYALLAIGLLFSFAFCWVFDKAFRTLFAPVLTRVANIGFGGISGHFGAHPFSFLHRIVTDVERWTARGMQASERGITYSLNQLIDSAGLLFGVPLAIALALYELAQYAVHAAGHAITRIEHTTVIRKIVTTAKVITEVTRTQFAHLTARVATLERIAAHAAHATAGAIANPFPRIRTVERDLSGVKRRVGKLEKQLALGVGAALLVRSLAKLGLGWLRCGNVNKAGRELCGLNPSTLETLLLDVAALTIAFNLEDFAKEMQAVTEEAAGLIHNWAT